MASVCSWARSERGCVRRGGNWRMRRARAYASGPHRLRRAAPCCRALHATCRAYRCTHAPMRRFASTPSQHATRYWASLFANCAMLRHRPQRSGLRGAARRTEHARAHKTTRAPSRTIRTYGNDRAKKAGQTAQSQSHKTHTACACVVLLVHESTSQRRGESVVARAHDEVDTAHGAARRLAAQHAWARAADKLPGAPAEQRAIGVSTRILG